MGAEQSTGGFGTGGRQLNINNAEKELSIPGQSGSEQTEDLFNVDPLDGELKRMDNNGNKSNPDESLMTRSTLVVVKSVPVEVPKIESDPIFQRLNSIPNFLPVIDNPTKRFLWSKLQVQPQELASKLHTHSVIRIGRLYNGFVRKHTTIIVRNQQELNKQIKQVDKDVASLFKVYTTHQRKCAHYALKLEQVSEISKTISKCQTALTDVLKTAETLNDLLPPEEQLERFEWRVEDQNQALNINVKEETPISVTRSTD